MLAVALQRGRLFSRRFRQCVGQTQLYDVGRGATLLSPIIIIKIPRFPKWFILKFILTGAGISAAAAGADVESVASIGVAAEQQALDDLIAVSAVVWCNLIFQAEVTPAVPVVEEDLAEAVVTGGDVGATPRG